MNRAPVLAGLAVLSVGSLFVGISVSSAAAPDSSQSLVSAQTSVARFVSVHASPVAFSATEQQVQILARMAVPRTGPARSFAVAIFVPGRAVRTVYDRVFRYVRIPFTIRRVADAALFIGISRVLQAGSSGQVRLGYVRSLRRGHLQSIRLATRILTRTPRTLIVGVGTRHRVVTQPRSPVVVPRPVHHPSGGYPAVPTSVSSLDWAALASCESGGRSDAIGSGGYYGLYQFTIGTWDGVGGTGLPSDATAADQTYRAELLYERSGSSSWPYCGRFL
jgi:hypothetical protein